MPDDEQTLQQRNANSLAQVKGDIADVLGMNISLGYRVQKLEKVIRVLLVVMFVLCLLILVRVNVDE